MSQDPEPALIHQAAQGDRQAAGELLTSILPRVRNLVRYLVRGDGEVDDIAQQCLVAILLGLAQYRGDGTFVAWADRITARQTFREIKKERKRKAVHADVRVDQLVAQGEATTYRSRRDLVRLLDRIPDEQRTAVVLHHLVGFSVTEIASLHGVPFDTVKSRLRLGMKKLRQLQEEEP